MIRGPRARALAVALGVLSIAAQKPAPVQIDGPWEGAIQVGAGTLRMRVVFTETPAELRAVIDIPQQGASGLALAAVSRADSNVHFELPTPSARALRSVITPREVERIATPSPFITRGMSCLPL